MFSDSSESIKISLYYKLIDFRREKKLSLVKKLSFLGASTCYIFTLPITEKLLTNGPAMRGSLIMAP